LLRLGILDRCSSKIIVAQARSIQAALAGAGRTAREAAAKIIVVMARLVTVTVPIAAAVAAVAWYG
jgi:hypothetical protein